MSGQDGIKKQGARELLQASVMAVLTAWTVLFPTLFYPLARDQSIFTYVGRVMAHGGMPYRDAWDLKPPAVYVFYSWIVQVAEGCHLTYGTTLRGVDMLVVACTVLLLVRVARRLGVLWAGPLAAGWYALLYLRGGFWSLSQAEVWANLPLLGAALFSLSSEEEERRVPLYGLTVGLLLGLAALLKWTTVMAVLPFLLLPLRRKGPGRWTWLLTGVVGFVLPLLAAWIWLRHGGAWEAYAEIQTGFVAPYARVRGPSPGEHVTRLLSYTLGWFFKNMLFITLFGVIGVWRAGGWRPGARRLTLLTLLCAYLSIVLQDKYFGYHWQVLFPMLALQAGMGTLWLVEQLPRGRSRLPDRAPAPGHQGWNAAAGLLFVIAAALLGHGSMYVGAARVASGQLSWRGWVVRFGRPYLAESSYLANLWVADYVRAHTRPGETIQVWGFEPIVYLLTGRYSNSRFFFSQPVTVRFSPEAWRGEFMRDLERRPPELFVVVRNDHLPWAIGRSEDSMAQLAEFDALSRFVAERYREEAQVEDFTIFRLRHGSAFTDGPVSNRPAPRREDETSVEPPRRSRRLSRT